MFTRTKHGADRVVKDLAKAGILAQAIHGNKSQNARQGALSNFKNGKTRVLVATDIAARGIDIDELTHVVNYELPNIPETYVHRIGRTGRAGLSGIALSFCDAEEKEYLRDIHKLIGKQIPVVEDHPYPMSAQSAAPQPAAKAAQGASRGGQGPGRGSSGGGRGGQGQPRGPRNTAGNASGNGRSNNPAGSNARGGNQGRKPGSGGER